MNFQRLAAIAAAILGIATFSNGAQAQTDTFRIDGNSTHTTDLTICNPAVRVTLTGSGNTDLDFVIYNSRGQVVHSDYDYSDDTSTVLYRRDGIECEDFEVQTSNLGGVANVMDVALTNEQVNSGNPVDAASYRVEANARHMVDLSICNPQVLLRVYGDGDTDLDFVIRDERGQVVHSDYALDDTTEVTLYRRGGIECEQFELETNNLGAVYNLYTVELEDVVQDPVTYSPK